jgi:phosphoribosylaminoimidazole carboxylase PurK protein
MQQTGKIGIVGGGQLGQMLTEAALPLGFEVIVLDPSPNSPAAQAGAKQIVENYDEDGISELASQVDYLTTEFEEGIDPKVLKKLAEKGVNVNPAPETIATILDKLDQKNYLSNAGIAMGSYKPISNKEEAYKLLEEYDGKMIIKTRRGGYDGYGNRVVKSRDDIDQALKDFEAKPIYAEAFVDFKKELAVMVVRGLNGDIRSYPVVETIQKNNICHEVLAPAEIDSKTIEQASKLARTVAEQFSGAGAFGVEMFRTKDNQIWLNEIAPRVHNSGHFTIEGCETSQFEQHIRAVTGMPLGKTDMIVPAAVMVNILGERNGPVELTGVEEATSEPHTFVHIYGKSPTKLGRKMGHITATGQTLTEARQRAELARKNISI